MTMTHRERGAKGGAENQRRQRLLRHRRWAEQCPKSQPSDLDTAYQQGYGAGKRKRLIEERSATR